MARRGSKCGLHYRLPSALSFHGGSFSRFGTCGKTYGKVFSNAERGARNAEMRRFYCVFRQFDAFARKAY
jgi:hypothetical protein